ncbi:hypothetical protein FACS1894147_12600 [Spirochaetia bacterium]|nr:hypothetical protein FACS1894147_12600 [Spirochaetia bacterium]
MRNNRFLWGTPAGAALVAVLAFSVVLAGCSGKKGGSGGGDAGLGDLQEAAELAKTAGDAAKALKDVSGSGGSSSKGGGTASKAEDFKYDLTADGTGVIIKGINVENPGAIKVPEKIEGYPVVEIADNAFGYGTLPGVTSVTLPNSVTKLGNGVFYAMGITKSPLTPNIKEIPDNCFGSTALTSITIPNGVTKIGATAFDSCKSLKDVVIPDSVTEMGYAAFSACPELTTVKLPSHPIKYGDFAFSGCSKLSLAVRKAITDSGYTGTF